MMEEKPGLGLQSGRAIDALIRVGTIKQPVCSLDNTLSPANYLPVAQKLSDSSSFFNIRKKNNQQTTDPPPTHRSVSLCHQNLVPTHLGGGGELGSLRAWDAHPRSHRAAVLIKSRGDSARWHRDTRRVLEHQAPGTIRWAKGS